MARVEILVGRRKDLGALRVFLNEYFRASGPPPQEQDAAMAMKLEIECPDVTRLREVLQGKLSTSECDELAAHLESCPRCVKAAADCSDPAAWVGSGSRSAALLDLPRLPSDIQERLDDVVSQVLRSAATLPPGGADTEATSADPMPRAQPFWDRKTGQTAKDILGVETLGGFTLGRVIGWGGMGIVFAATDAMLGRQVALKVIRPDFIHSENYRTRFRIEAKNAAQLDDSRIVSVYQFGEDKGMFYLVMPLLKGENLASRLRRGHFSAQEIVRLGKQVAEGLAVIHAKGWVHRDLKPSNVWLEERKGEVHALIMDFGLVREENGTRDLTAYGGIVGSANYMAPEQWKGKPEGRSDVFALGCVLYEMATGCLAYPGRDQPAVMHAIHYQIPPAPQELNADVPCDLSAYIMRLLAKSAADRPVSANVVATELQELKLESTRPEPPLFRWKLAGSLAALAAGIIAAIVFWYRPDPDKTADNRANAPMVSVTLDIDLEDASASYRLDGKSYTAAELKKPILLKPATHQLVVQRRKGKEVYEIVVADGERTSISVRPVVVSEGDRAAAQMVLDLGGQVGVKAGEERLTFKKGDKLPAQDFVVVDVNLHGIRFVDDAGNEVIEKLLVFESCRHIHNLGLGFTGIGDRGIECFKNCKDLAALDATFNTFTDKAMEVLASFPSLGSLRMSTNNSRVTDAGLAKLAACKRLAILDIRGFRKVTDKGVTALTCPEGGFHTVLLSECQIGDDSAAWIAGCGVTNLGLEQTNVTDRGVAALARITQLQSLSLNYTIVSDASVPLLAGLPALQTLHCGQTRISKKRFTELQAATRKTKLSINWSEANRVVAEDVLKHGGSVSIAAPDQEKATLVKKVDELPDTYFQVRMLTLRDFADNWHNLDSLVHTLNSRVLDRLETIDLSGAKDQAFRLVILERVAGLHNLHLANLGWTDKQLVASLPVLPELRTLVLNGNALNGSSLAHLKGFTKLASLALENNVLADFSAKHLAELKVLAELRELSLAGNSFLGDAAVPHLESLTGLERLDLRKTAVTAESLRRLQKALPRTKIQSDKAGD